MHVRRGDLKSEYLYNYGFRTGDTSFIERAMSHFVKLFDNLTFKICSDDITWCKQNISLPSDKYNRKVKAHYCDKTGVPIVDMGILAACNHSIITGGTFGWWSAFLAGG